MPDYIIIQRDRGQAEDKCLRPRPRPKIRGRDRGRDQIFKAEAKILASRPLNITGTYLHNDTEYTTTFAYMRTCVRMLVAAATKYFQRTTPTSHRCTHIV